MTGKTACAFSLWISVILLACTGSARSSRIQKTAWYAHTPLPHPTLPSLPKQIHSAKASKKRRKGERAFAWTFLYSLSYIPLPGTA